MAKAKLNSAFIATVAGEITVYNYRGDTREYISSSLEYLPVGVGIPANSCTDAPAHIRLVMQSAVLQILTHGNMCQTIAVKLSMASKRGNQKKLLCRGITLKIRPLLPH